MEKLRLIILFTVLLFGCQNSVKHTDNSVEEFDANIVSTIQADTLGLNQPVNELLSKYIYVSGIMIDSLDMSVFVDTDFIKLSVDTFTNRKVFENLSRFKKLRKVEISMDVDNEYSLKHIELLTNIESIIINGARYSNLREISKMQNLKSLHFEFPQFKSFPDEFWNLNKLEKLSFFLGEFKVIPAGIGQLKSLQTLDFNKSFIGSLPEEISELESLKELKFFHSEVKVLPISISRMKNLKILNITHSTIYNLSDVVDSLVYIKTFIEKGKRRSNKNDNWRNLTSDEFDKLKSINPDCEIILE